jgi:pimeloyl-ACP methyl ester carboxylesterase
MTLLRFPAPPAGPLLTRVPLSDDELPSLADMPWPWPGGQRRFGDLTVYVRETPGPGPDVPRALYLHGLGGSATNWTELAGLLAGDVDGMAVDLPGFGLSPPPANADYRMSAQADAVAVLLTELGGEPVHVFGNSMGGGIALLLAAKHPELVRTLTLISPAMPDLRMAVSRMSDPRMALAMVPLLGRSAQRSLNLLSARERTEQMLRLCFAEPERVSPERFDLAVAEHTERMATPGAGAGMGPAVNAIIRAWLAPPERSMWAVAHRVHVPTLVVWGGQDKVISVRKAARTTRMLRRGRLLVLPRTGHTAQMERPVTVARAVRGMWRAVDRGEW